MTSTGSVSVSGLLGGTAGQIDTTSLISQLMTAAALPQTQLKDQLTALGKQMSAYQTINTRMAALQTAAQALTDPTAWTATATTSSAASVVATSDGTAATGSTTFSVTRLAQAQISTVAADTSGNVADPATGITLSIGGSDYTFGSDPSADFALTSGSATDVAAAINQAGLGLRATVVATDQGSLLQLTSTKSGAANGFSASGFSTPAQTPVPPKDAQITVGNPAAGGYTVSSPTNTFSSFIPGVTFSVTALATDVTITVNSDQAAISKKVSALVSAANAAVTELANDSGQGAVLQGKSDVRNAAIGIGAAVSSGTATGASLKAYGIDMDSSGHLSFDADAFATAYAADPAGTKAAIAGSFATALNTTASAAVDPVTGSVTASISSLTTQESNVNDGIDRWTDRLAQIHDNLTIKYTAMETALAKLQSQQTYLTSMFKSITNPNSSSGSS
jgi:flagellar hook-associated protein 2